jgi:hypothetical protein
MGELQTITCFLLLPASKSLLEDLQGLLDLLLGHLISLSTCWVHRLVLWSRQEGARLLGQKRVKRNQLPPVTEHILFSGHLF